MLHNILKNTPQDSLSPPQDKRGKNTPLHINRKQLADHIESFKPSISHYRRGHSPNRRYLPGDISVMLMHGDFLQKNPNVKCSYDTYRNTLHDMKITITNLGHEECELCTNYKHSDPEHYTNDNKDLSCSKCLEYTDHLKRAKEAREKYQSDAAQYKDKNNVSCVSADLREVIMLPRMETMNTAMFTRRIVAFNESFVPLGKKSHEKPIAILWHEGIAGRKKEQIVSTFHSFFLSQRDKEKIVLWLDNCSGQNKNWTLLSFVVYMINSDEISASEVEMNYLEPGHTFISANAFHHQVELSMKHVKHIYDFEDFKNTVSAANSRNVIVKSMEPNDFIMWPDMTSVYKLNKQNPRPYLNKIVQFVAKRGKFDLLYKESHLDEKYKVLDFLQSKVIKQGFPKDFVKQSCPRRITRGKKEDIIKKTSAFDAK